jgi:hypothetical protein
LKVIGKKEYPLSELDLEIVSPTADGPLRFKIVAEDQEAELELQLFEDQEGPNYRFVVQGGVRAQVRRGERADADDATDFFYEDPPMIWFSDG